MYWADGQERADLDSQEVQERTGRDGDNSSSALPRTSSEPVAHRDFEAGHGLRQGRAHGTTAQYDGGHLPARPDDPQHLRKQNQVEPKCRKQQSIFSIKGFCPIRRTRFRRGNLICLPKTGSLIVTDDIHGHRRSFEQLHRLCPAGRPPRPAPYFPGNHPRRPQGPAGGCLSYQLLFDVIRLATIPRPGPPGHGQHDTLPSALRK